MPLLLKCEDRCKPYPVSIPCSAANHSAALRGGLPRWACRRCDVCLQQCVWMVYSLSWAGIQKLHPSHVFRLTVRFLIKGKSVFVQETICCRTSDVGFAGIDYCKEESRLTLMLRKVFVSSTFILELDMVVRLSTQWFRYCVSFVVFREGKKKEWPYAIVKPKTRDDVGEIRRWMKNKGFLTNGFWEEPGDAFR
jgi:hypothetical protein